MSENDTNDAEVERERCNACQGNGEKYAVVNGEKMKIKCYLCGGSGYYER